MHGFILFFLSITTLFSIEKPNSQGEQQPTRTLKGKILDSRSGQPVAYGNVGLKNRPFGTVSDSVGQFAFTIPEGFLIDTLQISRVGFKTEFLPVSGINNLEDIRFLLEEEVRSLPEVTIRPGVQRDKTQQIGRHKDGKLTQVSIHKKTSAEETLGSEMGMRYHIAKEDAVLKDFNFHISASNFNHIRFRLNIYSVKNELPDTLLFPDQILVDLDNFKTGWNKIELESYQIPLKDDVVITLQWIEHRMDYKEPPRTFVPVGMSLFTKNCYVRVASQDIWRRMGMNISNYITIAYP